jgi:predicted outer membrane lipoprotein
MNTTERSLAVVGGVLGGLLAAALGVPAAMAVESAAVRRNRRRTLAMRAVSQPSEPRAA